MSGKPPWRTISLQIFTPTLISTPPVKPPAEVIGWIENLETVDCMARGWPPLNIIFGGLHDRDSHCVEYLDQGWGHKACVNIFCVLSGCLKMSMALLLFSEKNKEQRTFCWCKVAALSSRPFSEENPQSKNLALIQNPFYFAEIWSFEWINIHRVIPIHFVFVSAHVIHRLMIYGVCCPFRSYCA